MDEIDNAAEKIADILTRSETGLSEKKILDLYCNECGTLFTPYKHGATSPMICKDCLNARAVEGKLKKYAEKTGITITQDDQHSVLVRFAPKDEFLHRALCEWAERERRTPEAQLLWMLEHYQPNVGGEDMPPM